MSEKRERKGEKKDNDSKVREREREKKNVIIFFPFASSSPTRESRLFVLIFSRVVFSFSASFFRTAVCFRE